MRPLQLRVGDHQPVVSRPAAFMLSPWAVGSIALLLLNDHVWKAQFGNVATGKLSDIAGVFLLPLLLLALLECGRYVTGHHPWESGRRATLAAVTVTGAGFAAVKLIPPVGDTYEYAVGVLRKIATLSGDPVAPIIVYRDWTDLLVLPVLAWSYVVVTRYRTQTVAVIV
jgi:hypothetical protein